MSGTSKTNTDVNEQPIEKAEEVIELFGGIRPMASKMDVAVTTVQGWKKRNVIPANRRDEVIKAAKENDIKLAPYIDVEASEEPAAPQKIAPQQTAPQANENKPQAAAAPKAETPKSAAEPVKPAPSKEAASAPVKPQGKAEPSPQPAAKPAQNTGVNNITAKPVSKSAAAAANSPKQAASAARPAQNETPKPHNSTHAELQAMTKKAAQRNLIVTGGLVAAALVLGVFIFSGDDVARVEQEVSALKQEVSSIDSRTSLLEGWMPKNLDKDIAAMKKEAQQLGDEVSRITATISSGEGSIMERVAQLENMLANGAGGQAMQDVLARIDSLSSGLNGQQELSAAMNDLAATVTGVQAQVDGVDAALERAKQDNDALAEALEGVTGRDLGAAAMLLALEHARTSFNRNEPFEDDLAVLQSIVGDSDPELNAAISKLAPYAKDGILTTENLSNELTTLSGDIIMAKVTGEEVSVQDKALQRFNEVVKLSKNGVPVNGSEEEAIIAKAQEALAKGDVEAAKAELSKLEGGAADAASSWMDKADGNLAAQNLEQVILQEVLTSVQGLRSGGLFNAIGGGATGGAVNLSNGQ